MSSKESRFIQSPIQIQITQESPDQPSNVTSTVLTSIYDQTRMTSSTSSSRQFENSETRNLEIVAQASMEDNGGSNKKPSVKYSNNNNTEIPTGQVASREEQTHTYKKRFFILALFCAHSAINSFQWIQYSSITNVIASYYDASNLEVNLTSLVYMITYIPFIIQASLMLERVGLRKAILLGTVGTATGSLIKWWMGGQPSMVSFWWMMAGQTIVALSQLYIISIPPMLAATWFPDHQVSTATGLGVFGNQLGIALGFVVPPWVISDVSANKNIIGKDLNSLSCAVFWISLIISVVSFITLEDKPPKPPGLASLNASHQQVIETRAAYASIKELCSDTDFRYLILSYGINVGCFYAVSTVLNQMVSNRWPQQLEIAGNMGLLIVISGMVGSVVCGRLLDRTHAYKSVIVVIYLFSLISMMGFTLILRLFNEVWPLYLASATLGFFMTGYLPLGFEFAAEITFPHPANTPAGLLNLFAQVFGLILTYGSSMMVDQLGDLWANTFLSVCLAFGLVLTIIMKADLKRQKAVAEEQMKF